MGGLPTSSPRKVAGTVAMVIAIGYLLLAHGGLLVLRALVTGH